MRHHIPQARRRVVGIRLLRIPLPEISPISGPLAHDETGQQPLQMLLTSSRQLPKDIANSPWTRSMFSTLIFRIHVICYLQ